MINLDGTQASFIFDLQTTLFGLFRPFCIYTDSCRENNYAVGRFYDGKIEQTERNKYFWYACTNLIRACTDLWLSPFKSFLLCFAQHLEYSPPYRWIFGYATKFIWTQLFSRWCESA